MNTIFDTHWLKDGEIESVIKELTELNLIKYDKKGNLLLKSGGTTDLYINLRNARSNPEAITRGSQLLSTPFNIYEQQVDRFVEIPHSISCLAGGISVATNTPYITIRDIPKDNRVSNSEVMGEYKEGDKVFIIDDVITDGESKIIPYKKCMELGLEVLAIVVLVDREQGWPETFQENNINVPVWAGMTLSQIREYIK